MVAPRLAINAATAGAWCARRLSSSTISPGCKRGASRSRTRAMKSVAFTAFHFVANVTQPVTRTAPIKLKLSPQFIGRGSTYFLAGQHPRVRPAHREIRPRFIDEHQATRIDPFHPAEERLPFRRDVGPIHF